MPDFKKVNHGFLVEARVLDATNGEEYNLTGCIEDVMVRKRYIEDTFPLVVLDMRTTEEMRNIMRDDDVSVYLKITYYNVDDIQTATEIDSAHVTEIGKIFEGIIRIYEKPFSTTASKVEEENGEETSQKESAPFVYYRMSGIPEDLISKNEECVNNIFQDATLADALVYEISSVDKSSNMFIQEPDNREVFNSILSPPVSIVESIEFLDDTYRHFYKHGYNLFIDSSGWYMYDIDANEPLTTNILECTILTTEATGDNETLSRPAVDSDGNIQLKYRNVPSFNSSEKIVSHTLGSHTIYYYYDENFNLLTKSDDNDESFNKIRYVWNYLPDRSTELTKKGKTITFTIQNMNPELITPLTKLRFVSSVYPEVAGDYIITDAVYVLSSADLKFFNSNISILGLKK